MTQIINTHTHGDHIGSNDFFPASVEIVAHANVDGEHAEDAAVRRPGEEARLPDKTYTDKLTVLGGTEAIDLYHFGPAHTNGDTFVVFRDLKVMHAGDVFARKGTPFIDRNNGGNGVAYPRDAGQGRGRHQGRRHGDPRPQRRDDLGGVRRIRRVQQGASSSAAQEAKKAGKTAEQAAAELKLPEKFKDYDVGRAKDNVKQSTPTCRSRHR